MTGHFIDLTEEELSDALKRCGEPTYRGRQLAVHYFEHLGNADQMTDFSEDTRKSLIAEMLPELLKPIREYEADDGATIKTLWETTDGARIESVLMGYTDRTTLCVSSQAGCGMGCPFCATGAAGLKRNLSAAEIVEQVRLAMCTVQSGRLRGHQRLGNIVFMGMGEPLANYKPLLRAIRAITEPSPHGFGISARSLTVSTCGLVPAMDRLSQEDLPLTLALSLHAPDDELRNELVPVNKRWPVDVVLDAARRYFDATHRRVSIEYALIRDINDQAWRADKLAEILNERGEGWVHVNPIPMNPVPGSKWTASEKDVEKEFVRRLRSQGVTTTIRDTRGRDIDGACGQLAAEETS